MATSDRQYARTNNVKPHMIWHCRTYEFNSNALETFPHRQPSGFKRICSETVSSCSNVRATAIQLDGRCIASRDRIDLFDNMLIKRLNNFQIYDIHIFQSLCHR